MLKRKNLYYGYIQGQMMVIGIKDHVFLFFNKEYYTLEPINIDKEFCAQLSSSNITLIFRQYLASQLKID